MNEGLSCSPVGLAPAGPLVTTPSPPPSPGRRVPMECGDLPFVIRRDGVWLYRGTSIDRKELVCLFASVL